MDAVNLTVIDNIPFSGADTVFSQWRGSKPIFFFMGAGRGGPKLYFKQRQRKKEGFTLYFEHFKESVGVGLDPPVISPVSALAVLKI